MLHKSRILSLFITVYLLVILVGTVVTINVPIIYSFPPLIISIFCWKNVFLRYGSLLVFIFLLSFAQTAGRHQDDKPFPGSEFYGTVVSEPKKANSSQSVLLENGDIRAIVFLPEYPLLQIGDRVRVWGEIVPRSQDKYFANNPGYFYLQRISYVIKGPVLVGNYGLDEREYLSSSLFHLQRRLIRVRQQYEKSILMSLPQPQSGLAVGILLGNRDYLDINIENIFITVGIIHIIALSGYNITIIARGLDALGKRRSAKASFYAATFGIWFFVAATGFSASVVRAAIMGMLVLLARKLGRQSDSFAAILIAAGVMVFLNPLIIRYDIGFQLSFAAMAGIIFLTPKLATYFHKLGSTFSEIVSSTIAAQIFTLPLLSYYFGRISLVSPVANILVLPFLPLIMILIFAVGTVGLVSQWLAKYIGLVLWIFLGYVVKISEILSSVPKIEKVYSISFLTMIAIYIIMIELIFLMGKRGREGNIE